MKNMYKIALLLLLIPLVATATDKRGKYTKNKKVTKNYTVNKDASLFISNKYGNINIITGDSNSIEIEVNITTNGDNEAKVQERLNQINIEFSGSSSTVTAKTIIVKNSSSWGSWGRKNNNVNMEINYIIKMPVTNNVDLSNDYGGINLDKIEGTAKIDCDYGKITIGELLNPSNSINIDYTNKSTIEFMKNGTINADYSTLHIEKSGTVDLNADYSHISFGMVSDLDFNCDYGDLKIDNCSNIVGNCDYMHTSIGKLFKSGSFDIDYGSLKINALSEGFEVLNVESSYTQIKLGVNSSNSFNIEAKLTYGNLKYGNNFTFNKEITKSSSKYYQGFYNNSNSTSSIKIDSNYGNITFTTN